jgi:hypothetical protein
MQDSTPERKGTSTPSDPPASRIGTWIVMTVLVLLLVAAAVIGYLGWTSTDTSVPISGYIAMAFGVIFSLAIGIGLMALLFYSSRAGYDEPAVLIETPEDDRDDAGKNSTDKPS